MKFSGTKNTLKLCFKQKKALVPCFLSIQQTNLAKASQSDWSPGKIIIISWWADILLQGLLEESRIQTVRLPPPRPPGWVAGLGGRSLRWRIQDCSGFSPCVDNDSTVVRWSLTALETSLWPCQAPDGAVMCCCLRSLSGLSVAVNLNSVNHMNSLLKQGRLLFHTGAGSFGELFPLKLHFVFTQLIFV